MSAPMHLPKEFEDALEEGAVVADDLITNTNPNPATLLRRAAVLGETDLRAAAVYFVAQYHAESESETFTAQAFREWQRRKRRDEE